MTKTLVAAVMVGLTLLIAMPLGHSASAAPGQQSAVSLVVIVAAQSTLRDIPHGLLRRIFLGEPSEHAGKRLLPLNYGPDDPLRIAFDQRAFGMSKDASGRYWVDRRIRGQGLPPRTVPTQMLMRAVVARLPGAVGYLTADQLNDTVRAVTIDGRAHDAADYPLRVERR